MRPFIGVLGRFILLFSRFKLSFYFGYLRRTVWLSLAAENLTPLSGCHTFILMGIILMEIIMHIIDIHSKEDIAICRKRFNLIKQRCYNPKNPLYKYYGGRGIKIYDEWLKNINIFIRWSIDNGYFPELTIDRIDNDGDYVPSNCRWIEQKEQTRNRRSNVLNHKSAALIKSLINAKISVKYISNLFNVKTNVVRNILYKNTWDDVKPASEEDMIIFLNKECEKDG